MSLMITSLWLFNAYLGPARVDCMRPILPNQHPWHLSSELHDRCDDTAIFSLPFGSKYLSKITDDF